MIELLSVMASEDIEPDSTEIFIDKIRRTPVLYNANHPDYKNVRKKDRVWERIGKAFDMDGMAAKKKWKSLRDTYQKYNKSINTPTGQTVKKFYGHWIWANQMHFLAPHLTSSKTGENSLVDQNNYQNEDSLLEESFAIASDEADTKPLIAGSSFEPEISDSLEVELQPKRFKSDDTKKDIQIQEVLHYLRRKSQTDDDLENLFLCHARSVKKFSRRRQAIVKLKIAQIIAEQELLHIDEDHQNNAPYELTAHNETVSVEEILKIEQDPL